MNRHWMGGARKRVAERRGSKVERQQKAYFEARRQTSTTTAAAAAATSARRGEGGVAARLERPLHDPTDDDDYTSSVPAPVPLRTSLDLMMLLGPPLPAAAAASTRKRSRAVIDSTPLAQGASSEKVETSMPVLLRRRGDCSPEQLSPTTTKRPARRDESADAAGGGSKPLAVLVQDQPRSGQFKAPAPKPKPKPKPKYFLSRTAQPLHKVRFFDEGIERTDEEYLKDAAAPPPLRVTHERARRQQLSAPPPHDHRPPPPRPVVRPEAHYRDVSSSSSSVSSGFYFIDAGLEPLSPAFDDDADAVYCGERDRPRPPSYYRLSAIEE